MSGALTCPRRPQLTLTHLLAGGRVPHGRYTPTTDPTLPGGATLGPWWSPPHLEAHAAA